jgi:hypothetical protein
MAQNKTVLILWTEAQTILKLCETRDFHGGEDVYVILMGFGAV